jgi:heat shock protein HslJ
MRRMAVRCVLWTGAAAVLCSVTAACSRNEAVPGGDIRGVTWTLVEVNGAPVDTAAMNRPATLLLDEQGHASGYGGCNQFGGPYTIDGEELHFGPIAMTRMACPDRMDVETSYSSVFDATRSWRLSDGMLELIGDGRVIARFRR